MANNKNESGGDVAVKETSQLVEPATTSKEEPEPTEETVTLSSKELNDRINAEKAKLGRTLKTTLSAHSALKQQFDAQGQRLVQLEKTIQEQRQRQREQELKAADGTPDLVDSVRLKHQAEDGWEQLNKARSDHERERSQYQAELDEATQLKALRKAEELAKESNLTADLLLQIGSDTAESGRVTYNFKRMEAIAKSVPKTGEEPEETEAEATGQVKGQKSVAAGAGARSATRGLQTIEDYDKAYNEGLIDAAEYQKARIRFGVAY